MRIFFILVINSCSCSFFSAVCPVPPLVKNADIPLKKSYYFIDEVVKYACLPGYVASGIAFLRCNSDQTWSEPQLTCSGMSEIARFFITTMILFIYRHF